MANGASSNMLYYFCRYSAYYHIWRDIFSNHGTRRNDCVVTDSYSGGYSDVRANPDPIPNMYWLMGQILTFGRVVVMVESGHYNAVAYQYSVAYEYASLVLKMATGVDKHIFPHMNIPPEVGIKRREKSE